MHAYTHTHCDTHTYILMRELGKTLVACLPYIQRDTREGRQPVGPAAVCYSCPISAWKPPLRYWAALGWNTVGRSWSLCGPASWRQTLTSGSIPQRQQQHQTTLQIMQHLHKLQYETLRHIMWIINFARIQRQHVMFSIEFFFRIQVANNSFKMSL